MQGAHSRSAATPAVNLLYLVITSYGYSSSGGLLEPARQTPLQARLLWIGGRKLSNGVLLWLPVSS